MTRARNNGKLEPRTGNYAAFVSENGGIFKLDGNEDFISTSTLYTPQQVNTFSVGIWFKTTESRGRKLIGFESNQTASSSSYDRQLYIGTDGKLYFGVYDQNTSVTNKTVSSTEIVNDDHWYYGVGTYTAGGLMKLYVDGVKIGELAAASAQQFSGYWKIGGFNLSGWPNGTNGYLQGSIGPTQVYNRALTDQEIFTNYNAEKANFKSAASPSITISGATASSLNVSVNENLDLGTTTAKIVVQSSISQNGPWTTLPSTKTFTDSNLSASTTFYYRTKVTQSNKKNSDWSLVVSSATLAAAAPSPSALVFPRVAILMNGSRHKYDTASWQQSAARYDLALWGAWETWGNEGRLMSFTQACANLKALNPNVKLFVYKNWIVSSSGDGGVRPVYRNTINAQNWWLRTSFPGGSIITAPAYGDVFSYTNTLPGGPTLNGQSFAQWVMSTYVRDVYVNGVYPQNMPANPHIDGFFFDNVFMMYDVNGDWNRDGVSDAQNNLALGELYRQGIVEGVAAYRALLPGKPFFANNVRGMMYYNPWNLPAPPPEFAGLFDYGLLEFYTGEWYSPDESQNAATMLRLARNHAAQQTKPEHQVMHSARRHTLTSTNFQDARYAIAAQLCASDGYICYKDATGDGGTMETGYETAGKWFDEFDNAGTQKYYLGTSVDPIVTTPWSEGVYRRRFANGWVLWNPRGNGIKTIQLGQSMKKIQGRVGDSDTTVNNGAQVTKVTLQDRDGLVLLNMPQTTAWFPDWPTMRVNSGNGLENELLSSSRTTENKQYNLESYSRYDIIGPATPVYGPTLGFLNTFYDLYKSVKDKRAQAGKPFTVKILPYFSIEVYKPGVFDATGEITSRGQFYQLIEGKPFTDSVVKQYVDPGGGQPQWWLRTVKPVGSLGQQVEAEFDPNALWKVNPATHLIPRNNKNETLAEGYARIQQELFNVPLTSGRTRLTDTVDGFWMDVVAFKPETFKINNGASTVQVDYDQNGVADDNNNFTINNSNYSAEGGAIKTQRGYIFFKNAFKQKFPTFMFGSNNEYAPDLVNISGNAGLALNSPHYGQFEYAMLEQANWYFKFSDHSTQGKGFSAITRTTSISSSAGSTSITVTNASGIVANALVTGSNIPSSTFVASNYTSGTTIPLTRAIATGGVTAGASIQFGIPYAYITWGSGFSYGNWVLALQQACLADDSTSASGKTFVQMCLYTPNTSTTENYRKTRELYRFMFGIALLHPKVAIGSVFDGEAGNVIFDIDEMHWYLGNPKRNRSMGTLNLNVSQYFDNQNNAWQIRSPDAASGSAQFWWEEFDNGLVVVRGDYTGYTVGLPHADPSLTAVSCPLPNPGTGYKWAFIPTSFTNPNTGLRSRNLDPTINNGADCTGGTYGQVSMFPATARVLRRAPILS